VWYLKCRALTLKNWIDDTEVEEEVRRSVPGRTPPASEIPRTPSSGREGFNGKTKKKPPSRLTDD